MVFSPALSYQSSTKGSRQRRKLIPKSAPFKRRGAVKGRKEWDSSGQEGKEVLRMRAFVWVHS